MEKGARRKSNPERDVMHIMTNPMTIFYANIPAVGNLVSSLSRFLLSFGGSPGVSGDGYEVCSASHQTHSSSSTSFLPLKGSSMALDARREWLLSNGWLDGTRSQSVTFSGTLFGQDFVCLLALVHLFLCLFCSHPLSAGGCASG